MTEKERQDLRNELDLLCNEVNKSEFVNPRSIRRIDAIRSLLITDGQSERATSQKGKPSGSGKGHFNKKYGK